MTDKELLHLREYCASLMTKYGFNLSTDNPATPMLYIIHREMEENNKTNKDIARLIRGASENMKAKNYHFNAPGEAWKFQMGIAIKWLIFGGLAIALTFCFVWYVSIQSDLAKAQYILDHEPALTQLLQQGKSDGKNYFMEFRKPLGDGIQFLTEYEQIDSRTVRVYIDKVN